MYKNISQEDFRKGMSAPDAIIMDVRSWGETMDGIIPNAKHIDIMGGNFSTEIKNLDPTKSYYVYCRSGNRSGAACGAMAQAGFTKLYNLVGGMMEWQGKVILPG